MSGPSSGEDIQNLECQQSLRSVALTWKQNLSSQFFDFDIENPLGGGTLAKIESSLYLEGRFFSGKVEFFYAEGSGRQSALYAAAKTRACIALLSLAL